MQEQGKRLLLAVALGLGVILLWNVLFHKEEPPPAQHTESQGSGSAKPGTPSPASVTVPPIGAPEVPGAESPAPAPDAAQDIALTFPNFVATFSGRCGGLTSWKLTDPRYERDATRGELLPA